MTPEEATKHVLAISWKRADLQGFAIANEIVHAVALMSMENNATLGFVKQYLTEARDGEIRQANDITAKLLNGILECIDCLIEDNG